MKSQDLKQDPTLQLEVTPYLTLAQKMFVLNGSDDIQGLITNILVEQDGLYKIDRFKYEMNVCYQILSWYGNLEFDEDFTIEDYDFAIQEGLIDYIKAKAHNDINIFMDLLDKMLADELQARNSIQSVFVKIVNQFMEKLDDLSDPEKIKSLTKEYRKVVKKNPEILDLVKQAFPESNLQV